MVIQTIIVALLLLACLAYVGRGLYRTLTMKPGGAGKCCSKGCDKNSQPNAKPTVVFIPVEFFAKKR